MDPNIQQQVLQRVDALAAKSGVAADSLMALYTKQALIDGWECAITSILCSVFATVGGILVFRAAKKDKEHWDFNFYPWSFVVILCVAGVTAAGVCGYNAIDLLVNPKLWAFKNLVANLNGH